MQTLKSRITTLKTDMNLLSISVSQYLTDIKLGIERIESDRCTGTVQMKSELCVLKESVKSIQDICDLNAYKSFKSKPANIANEKRYINKTNMQRATRTDSQAHDSTVGNPVRKPVMDCAGNSGTVAVKVPLEKGIIRELLTLPTLVKFRHLSVVLQLVDRTPSWNHRHTMMVTLIGIIQNLLLVLIVKPMIPRSGFQSHAGNGLRW